MVAQKKLHVAKTSPKSAKVSSLQAVRPTRGKGGQDSAPEKVSSPKTIHDVAPAKAIEVEVAGGSNEKEIEKLDKQQLQIAKKQEKLLEQQRAIGEQLETLQKQHAEIGLRLAGLSMSRGGKIHVSASPKKTKTPTAKQTAANIAVAGRVAKKTLAKTVSFTGAKTTSGRVIGKDVHDALLHVP